jgi:hypothetical protein
MKALLISYDLKKASINQKTILHQSLYGYTDHSNNSKYKYEREGLLNKYPYIKLNRGVFIININDKSKILPILKKNGVNIQTLTIEIPKSQLKKI